jgi:hypothetical protein
MVAPPLDADAVHDTTDWVLAYDVPVTPVGTDGVVAGVAAAEGAEGFPEPTALVAATVNVYGVPLVSPVTAQVVPAVVQVKPPGDEVTLYEVTAEPPFTAGATQETADWVFWYEVAVTEVGTPGVPTFREFDVDEAGPDPAGLVAVTVKV